MALRKMRFEGDPVLNKVCKEVKEMTPRTRELIDDMIETMYMKTVLVLQHLRWVL